MVTIETVEKELADYEDAFEHGHYHTASVHARMLAYFAREAVRERDSRAGDVTRLMETVRGEAK